MTQKNFLFAPTEEQIQNAKKERDIASRDLTSFPYYELQKARSLDSNVAVISKEESKVLPVMPKLRETYFEQLPSELQKIVLRANIAGVNLTASNSDGEAFLYMAPETEMERTKMIAKLNQIEQTTLQNKQSIAGAFKPVVTEEISVAPPAFQEQYEK